ncbi:MAG: hypothetical protein RI897_2123 [Verrucomicrobiota bacterium]
MGANSTGWVRVGLALKHPKNEEPSGGSEGSMTPDS